MKSTNNRLPSMAPSRKYNLNQRMYTEGDIYLGDHLTRSWTRDERGGHKQMGSPVMSEPGVAPSAGGSGYHIKQSHPPISRTRSSLREARGSRRNWAAKAAVQTVSAEEFHKWKISFDHLLKSPVGSKMFRVFLESEIAEENLLFWEACEELKQMKKEKRMQKLIQTIFDDFISVYSPREINIDYKMREDIVEQLSNTSTPDPNVFREAQMQIYHLMHRDSYPRFLASAQSIQIERSHALQRKVGKRSHQQCSAKYKVNTKSRVLCCYSDDAIEHETAGQFVSTDNSHMKVHESHSRHSNVDDPTLSPSENTTKVTNDENKLADDHSQLPSEVIVTSPHEIVKSQLDEEVKAEVALSGTKEELETETIDCDVNKRVTDATHCDNDLTKSTNDDILENIVDVTIETIVDDKEHSNTDFPDNDVMRNDAKSSDVTQGKGIPENQCNDVNQNDVGQQATP